MKHFFFTLMLTGMLCSQAAWADAVVIIVNKDNTTGIDRNFISKVYTGEAKIWASGEKIMALDLPENNAERAEFSQAYLGRSVNKLKLLWMQNVFAGKANPPKVVETDEEVKKLVAANKNAIGYISASNVDSSVTVVAK